MLKNDAFRALDHQECLRLLAKVPVGRVVCTRQALPAVLPINFSLDTASCVLLCTSPGPDLVRAIDGVVVAFEADEFDRPANGGWEKERGWVRAAARRRIETWRSHGD